MGDVKTTPKIPWTYRVNGIPLNWDKSDLSAFLINDTNFKLQELGFEVQSLAPNPRNEYQTATIDSLDGTALPLSIRGKPKTISASDDGIVRLQCDDDFRGLTTLYCPSKEQTLVDVVAVCGLNGHPIGSFRSKKDDDDYMWLRDALPKQLTAEGSNQPFARIMTYGYESAVAGSKNSQHLGDIAAAFRESLGSVGAKRPLIFIAHSLGGLVVKETMIDLAQSKLQDHKRLLDSIYGVVFFGVPHAGMSNKTLIAMAGEGPALALVVNLSQESSQVLDKQRLQFIQVLKKGVPMELFCFYETLSSPTAVQVNSRWKMEGPEEIFVTKTSATHCSRLEEAGPEDVCPIMATHSDIVKFRRYDPAYDPVRQRLTGLCCRAVKAGQTIEDPNRRFLLPFTMNKDFIGRASILDEIKARFELGMPPSQRACRRLSLYGLGGIGKTQIAISFAYWVKEQHKHISVFWVHASAKDRFRQAYSDIATLCDIPGRNDPQADILQLVHDYLKNNTERPWVLIIDNADDRELFFSSQVDELGFVTTKGLGRYLPECQHGSILMTTRDSKAGSDFMYGRSQIEVGELLNGEALELINRTLGHNRATAEEALKLSTRMENLPLAIAQALAYIDQNSITIDQYIRDLGGSNDSLVEHLCQPFQTVGRDTETPNAVTAALVISLRQIRSKDGLADEFISLMSMFDRHAIQDKFIDFYVKRRPIGKPHDKGGESKIASLGTLKAYSFITPTQDGTYNMHRLVQLVTRKWMLKENRLDGFSVEALAVMEQACPTIQHETMDDMIRILPHARAVLRNPLPQDVTNETKRAKGVILKQMGSYFVRKSQFNDAETHAEEAYQLLKESCGAGDHSTLLAVALRLEVYDYLGRYAEGTTLAEKENRRAEEAIGRDHTITLRITSLRVMLHFKQGHLKEAEKLSLFVLDAFRRRLGDEHAETVRSMDFLGMVYLAQNRLDEALELLTELVERRTSLSGKEHPDTLVSQHNLAHVLSQQGKHEEAGSIIAQVAEIQKRVIGPEHSHTLSSLNSLAHNYARRGHFKEAEELSGHVWRLQRRILGQDHPRTLACLHRYACILQRLGRLPEAIELMHDVWTRNKAALGAEHANSRDAEILLRRWEGERGEITGAPEATTPPETTSNRASAVSTPPESGRSKTADASVASTTPETGKSKETKFPAISAWKSRFSLRSSSK